MRLTDLKFHWDNQHGPFPLPKVPDYRIYKVKDVPQLETTRRLLAQEGLKDPWLRNHVWRYAHPMCQDRFGPLKFAFLNGFKYGFAAFLLTVAVEKTYHYFYPKQPHGSYYYQH